MAISYAWKKLGSTTNGKAHLVIGQVILVDGKHDTSLCGATVDTAAPYAKRCENCRTVLASLAEAAFAPTPTRIAQRVHFTLERNTGGEGIQPILERKLRNLTSMTIRDVEVEDLGPVQEA